MRREQGNIERMVDHPERERRVREYTGKKREKRKVKCDTRKRRIWQWFGMKDGQVGDGGDAHMDFHSNTPGSNWRGGVCLLIMKKVLAKEMLLILLLVEHDGGQP